MHGYTTALLAAVFQRVIAVDIFAHCLGAAARHARHVGDLARKITFLHMDSKADDWRLLAQNNVSVVVIDAAHDYHAVRSDAEKALRHLPRLPLGRRKGLVRGEETWPPKPLS